MTAAATSTTRPAEIFHALSDPIRLDVIALLLDGERCVCELMDELDLAQSRLSWHLKTLSDAGLISGRRDGRWNYYSMNADAVAEARDVLDGFLGFLSGAKLGRRLRVRSACCD